jgi:RNA recognition motif-containing protein
MNLGTYHRLYVGGIAGNLDKSTIENRIRAMFSRFGDVSKISISEKLSRSGSTFIHLQVTCSPVILRECIQSYQKCVWKGKKIIVERARPTHSERLSNVCIRFQKAYSEMKMPTWDNQSLLFIEGRKRNSIFQAKPASGKRVIHFPEVEQRRNCWLPPSKRARLETSKKKKNVNFDLGMRENMIKKVSTTGKDTEIQISKHFFRE